MKHSILCIDDEAHNLEALERLLRRHYIVHTAISGSEGLKQLNQHNFSLIISDQKMPQMTGVEFFAQARKIQPQALRILLTGYTDLESVIGAINQGQIYRYITKPWEPDELRTTIEQAIELYDLKKTVEIQNQELLQANQALKSLDTMKSDFMMLINHELKTPLTGIFSYVQLLGEEHLNTDQSLYLDKIKTNTQRLQDLIDDTLLITRIKGGTTQEGQERQDLAEMTQELWQQLKSQSGPNHFELKIEPDHFEQSVHKSNISTLMTKILKNVLAHGSPTETAQMQFENLDDHWQICLSNKTCRDLPENIQELTSAFGKTGSILNHSGGAGLGLAVTQAICQMLGGELELEGQDQHFTIKIRIPKN